MPSKLTWPAFTNALAGVLSILEDGQVLILRRRRTSYYAQFVSAGRRGLRAEVASNAFLQGKQRLAKAQIARLQDMGWSTPTERGPEAKSKQGSPGKAQNFFRNWSHPVSYAEVADSVVATLKSVYRVKRPTELLYSAFSEGGVEILLPTLPIDRKPTPKVKPKGQEAPIALTLSSHDELVQEVSNAIMTIVNEKENLIVPDADGDFPLGTEHNLVFVRVAQEDPAVHLFSALLLSAKPEPALLDALNRLNTECYYATFQLEQGRVLARHDLLCSPFVPFVFTNTLRAFCTVVDEAAPGLRSRFGGDEDPAGADPLWAANQAAERATSAWLKAGGLARAADQMRLRDASSPIPAPVIDQWYQKLVHATTNSVRAADAVLDHINGEARFTPKQLAAQVDRTANEAATAEHCLRALAQLTLGVTSHTEWDDETARLERAATLVLARSGVKVEDDDVVLFGTNESELVTEVAGLICRMLTQQDCTKVLGNPRAGQPAVELVVDDESNLLVRCADDARTWDAPVTVIEPARYVAEMIAAQGVSPPDA